jgi:cyanate permease
MTDPKQQETSVQTVGILTDIPTVHMTVLKQQEASVRTVGVLTDIPTVDMTDPKPQTALFKDPVRTAL